MRTEYPIVDLTTEGVELVPHRGVDPETLSAELAPLRDAFLELFKGTSGRARAGLQRLEVGLSITRDGRIAFATGNAIASVTLTFERRPPTPSPRPAAVKPAETAEPEMVKPAETAEPEMVTLD